MLSERAAVPRPREEDREGVGSRRTSAPRNRARRRDKGRRDRRRVPEDASRDLHGVADDRPEVDGGARSLISRCTTPRTTVFARSRWNHRRHRPRRGHLRNGQPISVPDGRVTSAASERHRQRATAARRRRSPNDGRYTATPDFSDLSPEIEIFETGYRSSTCRAFIAAANRLCPARVGKTVLIQDDPHVGAARRRLGSRASAANARGNDRMLEMTESGVLTRSRSSTPEERGRKGKSIRVGLSGDDAERIRDRAGVMLFTTKSSASPGGGVSALLGRCRARLATADDSDRMGQLREDYLTRTGRDVDPATCHCRSTRPGRRRR